MRCVSLFCCLAIFSVTRGIDAECSLSVSEYTGDLEHEVPLGFGLALRFKADMIVDGIPKSLLTAQVSLGCLNADVSK